MLFRSRAAALTACADEGSSDGFVFAPMIDLEEGAAVAWNGDGEPVWA